MPCAMRPVGQVLRATIPTVLGDADHKLGVQSALETSALARDHPACSQVNRARVTPCGHRPSVVRVGSGGGAGKFDENISVDLAMVEQLKVACEATPGPASVKFARPRFGHTDGTSIRLMPTI